LSESFLARPLHLLLFVSGVVLKSKIPTFFLNPSGIREGRLEKGLGGAEATLVSGSF